MELSNSLLATGMKLPLSGPVNRDSAQPRAPQNLPATIENGGNASARRQQSTSVNPADLIRKAEAVQNARIQRDNTLADAPLKGQQAISAYQQTAEASRQFEEGELVGIDLYV